MGTNEWVAPKGYKINSESEIAELISDENITKVVDQVDYIIDELFSLRHPNLSEESSAREQFSGQVQERGLEYGRWFHFSWDSSLVRFPEEEDHYDLRTFRNRNLITPNEQQSLKQKKIAVFGLSVGSNVIDNTVQSGIGNKYLLFDPDRLSMTNLNRVRATMGHVGLLKTTIAGRKIAELDPYVSQQHFSNGYELETDNILLHEKPDIIVEETDDVRIKARIRNIANKLGVPVVTVGDVDDRLVLDIERYDIGVKPFNGKLTKKEYELLVSDEIVSGRDKEKMLIKMLGMRNLSPRLVDSGMARGVELAGFPQLGTTSAAGGAIASAAIRDIILDRDISSGTRVESIRKVIKSKKPTTIAEDIDIMRRFIGYRRNNGR